MDELENQTLPQEPEHKEEPIAEEPAVLTEEESAVEEASAEEDSPAVAEEAAPAVEPVVPTAPQPRRRSPYENSPYMMPHQQPYQAPPAQPEKPEKPQKERKDHPALRGVLQTLAFVVLAFSISLLVGIRMKDGYTTQIRALEDRIGQLQAQLDAGLASGESVSGTPNVNPEGGMTPAQVYARNQQSVVLIETDVATGSGFILTEDGYVVTNYHVVEDGAQIYVVLYDRSYHEATLVGYEAGNDVALLKMEGEGYPAVTLGSSDALIVGDQVAAIGNPLGELTSTLTVGYVSAKERDVSTDSTVISMIQTDCAINSGNSGGPLFNMKGEVVGITSAKYSGMSSSGASIEGIGFAIPMDDAVSILEDLMEFGYVKSAYLGVSVYTLDPGADYPPGCLVDSVVSGGCADAAGVLPGDIIVGLGGYTIEGYTDLGRALREFDGGETTTITVHREGQGNLTLTITLDAKPREGIPQPEENPMPQEGSYEEWYNYFFGE